MGMQILFIDILRDTEPEPSLLLLLWSALQT
jgi:hypothetical protein